MISQEKPAYFDYNATAVLLPHIAEKMARVAQSQFGNPSSPHQKGREAKNFLEDSRARLACLLGIEPDELLFTSGGSESNNSVLRQFLQTSEPVHIITSRIEHPSILETCRILERMSHIEVSYLPVDSEGQVVSETLKPVIRPHTRLISIMAANNETGVIQPVEPLAAMAREYQIPFHVDCVQGLGKIPMDWREWGIHYASATAHKFGGPRGIGLLYIKKGTPFTSLIAGGKQERERRAGTENVVLAHGFAEALDWTLNHREAINRSMTKFKDQIIRIFQANEGFFLNGGRARCLPNTINFGWHGLSAESLLISLDLDQIAVSSGSACSSGAIEASPVLLAMGLDKQKSKACIRVSMGWNTRQEEVDYFVERMLFHTKRLYAKKQMTPSRY